MSDDTVAELQRAVGRVEGKLDAFLEATKNHSKRIGALERWRNGIAGGLTVAVFAWKYFTSK